MYRVVEVVDFHVPWIALSNSNYIEFDSLKSKNKVLSVPSNYENNGDSGGRYSNSSFKQGQTLWVKYGIHIPS